MVNKKIVERAIFLFKEGHLDLTSKRMHFLSDIVDRYEKLGITSISSDNEKDFLTRVASGFFGSESSSSNDWNYKGQYEN